MHCYAIVYSLALCTQLILTFSVLLEQVTVASVYWNQCDAFFIKFIENQRPPHVSSITCSSSGGAAQMAFGILRAYNVSWLWHGCSETATVPQPNAVCAGSPEDEQVMLETCRNLCFSINWMKSASCWFQYTDILWCTVSKTLSSTVACFHVSWAVRWSTKYNTSVLHLLTQRTEWIISNCYSIRLVLPSVIGIATECFQSVQIIPI
jgi:hypothetical protein